VKKRFIAILFLFGLLISRMPLSADAVTTTVRVGYCSNMAPYQYTNALEQPEGFHIDVLEAIAKRPGC